MSANPPSSAIYALNDDVLLYIFEYNGDMFANPGALALRTTRRTSQVCRHWRNLMLVSPFLWAKLIDMDCITNFKVHKWRNELVKRSGAAPLWIKAMYGGWTHFKYLKQFFVKFLTENWNRIQKIVVHGYFEPSLTGCMFSLTTPQLQHCEVPCSWLAVFLNKDGKIDSFFADSEQAPNIHSLLPSCRALDQRGSWLWHLHSLVLNNSYTLSVAFVILAATHNLRKLTMNDVHDSNMAVSLPTIFLSHLQHLEYSGWPTPSATFFDHVDIPMDCYLSIQIYDFYDGTEFQQEKPYLLSIIDTFIQHAQGTLQSLIPDHSFIDYVQKKYISWSFQTTVLPVKDILNIRVPLRGDSDANLLETFFKKLLRVDFTCVTKLRFHSNGRLNPCFALFLCRLTSVQVIYTNLKTLSQIARLQTNFMGHAAKKTRMILPNLKIIYLYFDFWSKRISFINDATAAFLLVRLQEGNPITMLDMTTHPPFNSPLDLRSLAGVIGLKVLYKINTVNGIVEYTYEKFGEMFRYNVEHVNMLH